MDRLDWIGLDWQPCFKFEMETPQTNASNLYLVNYIATGSISKEHSSNKFRTADIYQERGEKPLRNSLNFPVLLIFIIPSLLIHKIYPLPKKETSIVYIRPMSLDGQVTALRKISI